MKMMSCVTTILSIIFVLSKNVVRCDGCNSDPARGLEPRMHTNQHEFHRAQIRVNLCLSVVEKQCPVLTRPDSDRVSDP